MAAQCYLRRKPYDVIKYFSRTIAVTNPILKIDSKVRYVLSKEYEYKNSYAESYENRTHYKVWFFQYPDAINYLQVFNNFNEGNNFE